MGLRRMDEISANLNHAFGERWAKIQLTRDALRYSNSNSRLTMEVFLQEDNQHIARLLVERAENSKRISALIAELEGRCGTEEEKELLSAVEQQRTPYVQSYLKALRLLVDGHKRGAAATVMINETLPALFSYHAAWSEFLQFQMDQLDLAARQSRVHYAATRRVGWSVIVLAGFTAIVISAFVTRYTVNEMTARLQAETALNMLNAELEQRVLRRTHELASANQRLNTEIEERKRGETRLLESEERFRLAFEKGPLGIMMVGLDHRFIRVNDAFCKMTGYSERALRGIRVSDITHPEDVERDASLSHKILAGEIAECKWEKRYLRKDGRVFWAELAVNLIRDLAGQPLYALGIAADISERKEAEGALRQAEAKYRAIFEDALVGIYQSTPQGRFLTVNPTLASICGYESPNQQIAETTDLAQDWYVHSDRREEFKRLITANGAVSNFEFEAYRKDGTKIWLLQNARAVRDTQGEVQFYEGTVHDITERKLLEEQLRQAQKMEAVGRLAGGVAHDFNNALSVINGYSELLQLALPTEVTLRKQAEEIQKAGQRAATLTRQLLTFSRKQTIQPVALDLNCVVTDIEKMLRRLIGEDIDLSIGRDNNLKRVKADRGQMEQVLMNLAVNARDAMPQGGKLSIETANAELDEIYVRQHPYAKAGQYVMLSVSDSGCGMDKETQSHIFEPFFTTKELGKGTGLGLSTVYGIVKQSEGCISVYSELAKGTTFKIFLPQATNGSAKQTELTRTPMAFLSGKETILLVEDDDSLRELTRNCLQSRGYTVIEARDGKTALDLSRQHGGAFDLLLTDVIMPGISGAELAQNLAKLRPETKVLFMSGYPDDLISHHGILNSGTMLLEKPFDLNSLLMKIRIVLDGNVPA